MKKICAVLLLLCLSFNSFAASAGENGVSALLDEYNYSLMVEWDQKDESARQKIVSEFMKKMSLLMVNGTVTKNELLAIAEKRMGNKKSLEALKLKLSLTNNSQEMTKIVIAESKNFQQQGASWNGRSVGPAILLLLAVVALAAYFSHSFVCTEYEYRYDCKTSNDDVDYDCGYGEWCSDGEIRRSF